MDAAIADFHGDDRLVADYVRDEFLAGARRGHARLPRPARRSSTGSRATSATRFSSAADSAEVLRRLVRSNLLIIPLDGRDQRLPPPLAAPARCCSPSWSALDASVTSGLHTRASEWFRERGDVDRAVSHAIEAGDRDLAADLIWANVAALRHRPGATRRSAAGSRTSPRISSPRRLRSASPARRPTSPRATAERSSAGPGIALDRLEGIDDRERRGDRRGRSHHPCVRRRSRRRGEDEGGRPGGPRVPAEPTAPGGPLCHLIDGVSHHLCAEREDARRPLEEGARAAARRLPRSRRSAERSSPCSRSTRATWARPSASRSSRCSQIDHYGLGDHPTQALAFAVSALVRARRGRADAATADAKTAVRLQSGPQRDELPGTRPRPGSPSRGRCSSSTTRSPHDRTSARPAGTCGR